MHGTDLKYLYLAVFVCLNILKAYFPDIFPDGGDVFLPMWCMGATYYVISTGSNTSPYDTLAKGSPTIQGIFDNIDLAAGDIVEICADTVGGSKTFTENVTIGANDGGSAGNPVTIRGRSGDAITVTSSSGNYTWAHVDPSNVAYSNLTITSGVAAAFRLGGGVTNISFADCTYTDANALGVGFYISSAVGAISWTNCDFTGSAGKGFSNGTNNTSMAFTNCNFTNNGNYGFYNNATNSTFTNCDFSYNKSHGFCADGTSDSFILTGCTAHDNQAADTTYRHGYAVANGCTNWTLTKSKAWNVDLALDVQATSASNSNGTVTHNILIGKDAGQSEDGTGLFLGAVDASYSNSAINIYNNVIISEDADGDALYVGRYNASDIILKNNILYNSNAGNVYGSHADLAVYLTTDYNLWYSTKESPFNDKGTARTFAEWKTASSQDAHSVFADPLFRSATDYRLRAGSPAINKGMNSVSGTVTLANSRLSLVDGTAFADFSAAGTLNYPNAKLTLTDSAGKKAIGYIKAAGTGETLGTELLTNVEFTTDVGSWTPNAMTLTRVDSGTDPAVSSGGADKWVAKAVNGASSPSFSQAIANSAGILLKTGCRVYTPSANTKVNAGRILYGGATKAAQNTSEGAWNTISEYWTPAAANGTIYASARDASNAYTENDVAYFDTLYAKQVLTPSATGVTITSTPGGSVYNWASVESGFNYNDASGYTYTISDFLPTTDYLGKPIRGVPDIGAYEYYGATGIGRPRVPRLFQRMR